MRKQNCTMKIEQIFCENAGFVEMLFQKISYYCGRKKKIFRQLINSLFIPAGICFLLPQGAYLVD